MMWPFRKSRHPYPKPGPIRQAALLEKLRDCNEREDIALAAFRDSLIGDKVFTETVFAVREDEIAVLTELRLTREADEKRVDLAMRRAWAVTPLPPAVDLLPPPELSTRTDQEA